MKPSLSQIDSCLFCFFESKISRHRCHFPNKISKYMSSSRQIFTMSFLFKFFLNSHMKKQSQSTVIIAFHFFCMYFSLIASFQNPNLLSHRSTDSLWSPLTSTLPTFTWISAFDTTLESSVVNLSMSPSTNLITVRLFVLSWLYFL